MKGAGVEGVRGALGPSISGFVSEGPVRGFGSLASLGAKLEAPSFSNTAKGPTKTGFLGGFKPMGATDVSSPDLGGVFKPEHSLRNAMPIYTLNPNKPINPQGEIVFKPTLERNIIEPNLEPEASTLASELPFSVSDVLLEADQILSQSRINPIVQKEEAAFIPAVPKIEDGKLPDAAPANIVIPQPNFEPQINNPDIIQLEAVRKRIALLKEEKNRVVVKPIIPLISPEIIQTGVVIPVPEVVKKPISTPILETVVQEQEEDVLSTQAAPHLQAENGVSYRTIQVAETAPEIQEQLTEEVEQGLGIGQADKGEEHSHEHEKVDNARAIHIKDKETIVKRIEHVVEIFIGVLRSRKTLKGKSELVSIKGSEGALQLSPSNKQEVRGGEINSKDPEETLPDKTWDETVKQLTKLEFTSEEEIRSKIPEVVEINHPVAVATEGEVASQDNIVKSHEHIPGKPHAVIEFEQRRVKKEQTRLIKNGNSQTRTIVSEVKREEVVTENTIQDHSLLLAQALKAA